MLVKLDFSILNKVLQYGEQYNLWDTQRIGIAVSGGPDSVFLTHVLIEISKIKHFDIVLLHYNHKLREEADEDEYFVELLAKSFDVPIIADYYKGKHFDENSLRKARYLFFEQVKEQFNNIYIATGHNLNDDIETILFRLFRTGNIFSLHGIYPKRDYFIRPILFMKKEEILKILSNKNINYRIDKTNKQINYSRNYIRNEIIPVVEKKFKGFENAIIYLKDTIYYVKQDSYNIIERFIRSSHFLPTHIIIDKQYFFSLSHFEQMIIWDYIFIEKFNLQPQRKYFKLLQNIKYKPKFSIDENVFVEHNKNKIYIGMYENFPPISKKLVEGKNVFYDIEFECKYVNSFPNKSELKKGLYLDIKGYSIEDIEMRNKRDGDRIFIDEHIKLKKIFQSTGIPEKLRQLIPILSIENEIIAVGLGLYDNRYINRINSKYYVQSNAHNIIILKPIKNHLQ